MFDSLFLQTRELFPTNVRATGLSDSFFLQTDAIAQMNVGPIGPHLPEYVAFLQQHRYSAETIKCNLRSATAFSQWLLERQTSLTQLSQETLEIYRNRYRRKDRKPSLPVRVAGLSKLLQWLREQGFAPSPTGIANTEQQEWLARFNHYLGSVRGISPSTSFRYVRCASQFLDVLFGNRPPVWKEVTAIQVREFVTKEAQTHHALGLVCAMRATLRFLVMENAIHPGLIGAVPTVRRARLADVPCYLPQEDIQRVIAICDDGRLIGMRDKAIITVLARTGIRAGEAARITLSDIDWVEGRIIIRAGKTSRERVLPLPEDVGRCIVQYLKRSRPRTTCRNLFLRHRAPFAPLSPWTISWIAGYRIKQSGVVAARYGAHAFRHSAATHMVRHGASLKDIADILGHESLATTNIYAKLDLPNLAQVALCWPGGDR
jgi:site-specific recombinase XerD